MTERIRGVDTGWVGGDTKEGRMEKRLWVLGAMVGFLGMTFLSGQTTAHGKEHGGKEHGGSAMGHQKGVNVESGRLTLSLTPHYTPSPWTSEVGYGKQVCGKLAFGAKNLLFGWTDLYVEPQEAKADGRSVWSGVGSGVKDALENTLGGAVHLATFILPQVDAPLPEAGTHIW
jgi:hypothetical protein